MGKLRQTALFLVILSMVGCREEVVEELEDIGFKREWIPFGDAMGLPPLDKNYHYQEIPAATPWYVAQLAYNPYLVYVDSTGPGTNKFLTIKSETDKAQEMQLTRWENVGDLAGNRIRFTAQVRPSDWDGDISLGYSIEEDKTLTPVDITLPKDKWSKLSFEADLPPDVEGFVIMIEFEGKGEIAVDNCSIEKLGPSSKGSAPRSFAVEHRNLTFDDGPHQWPVSYMMVDSLEVKISPWRPYYYADEYEVILDSSDAHSGRYAGGLRSISTKPLNSSLIYMPIPSELVEGHKVKYSMWVKAKDLNGLLNLRASAINQEEVLEVTSRRLWDIHGNTEWTQISGEIDVPTSASTMNIILSYIGHGTVLVDDLSFERLDRLPDTKDFVDQAQYMAKPKNLGFEDLY